MQDGAESAHEEINQDSGLESDASGNQDNVKVSFSIRQTARL